MRMLCFIIGILLSYNFNVLPQNSSIVLKDNTGQVLEYYSSITEAYNAIPDSITHGYLIEILPEYAGAEETYPINFTLKKGAGANNTITLRPSINNPSAVIKSSLPNSCTIYLNECEYVIIDGRAGGTGTTSNLLIENLADDGFDTNTLKLWAASHNTIKYCEVIAHTQGVSPFWAENIYITSASWTNSSSYNSILFCQITGGGYGIRFYGSGSGTENVVRNCEIIDFSACGIYIYEEKKIKIENNLITHRVPSYYSCWGIWGTPMSNSQINFNKIIGLKSSRPGGEICGMRILFPIGNLVNITNNFISLSDENGGIKRIIGAEISGSSGVPYSNSINFYHNSIFIAGSDYLSSDTVFTSCMLKSIQVQFGVYSIKNNLFINKRTGGNKESIHTGATVSSLIGVMGPGGMDHNVYYASGSSNSFHAGWMGNFYNDIDEFKAAAAPAESHAYFKNIPYTSAGDLHLTPSSENDSVLKGYYEHPINNDIDGETRTYWYKGADELITITAISETPALFKEFKMMQNYPNPFNPTTKIIYSLKEEGNVRLLIYDIKGELISTFVNEKKSPGSYEIDFTMPGNKSTGIYLYRITVSDNSGRKVFSDVKKMLYLK